MKFNFALFFYATLGTLAIIMGFYFLEQIPLFAVLFFLTVVVVTILFYKEYSDLNIKKKVFNEKRIPNEINIKHPFSYVITTILSYLIFIIVSFFFIILYTRKTLKQETSIMIMPIAVIILFVVLIIIKIQKASAVIISLNSSGIQLNKRSRMSWNDIEDHRLRKRYLSHSESRFNERGEVNYLQFFYKGEKFEVIIDDLEVSLDELEHYLLIYKKQYLENFTI